MLLAINLVYTRISLYWSSETVCKDYIILYGADDIQLNNSNNHHYYKHASNLILISVVSDKLLEV